MVKRMPGRKKGIAVLTMAVRVPGRQFIAGDQWRYEWKPSVVREFIEHYVDLKENGVSVEETILTLAHRFHRKDAEVAILIMDLGERGFISATGRGSNILGFSLAAVSQTRETETVD